jgi:hypothetical protein
MNSLTNALKMAAVTLTVAAGCASAQDLKAEIPFMFKAGGAVLPAGSYKVINHGGMKYIQLRNEDTLRSILLVPAAAGDPSKAWQSEGNPKLGFVCSDGRCVLNQLWDGQGPTYQFHTPGFSKDMKTQVAVIVMHRGSGE